MPTLNELPVLDATDQTFTCSLNERRVQFRLIYSVKADRWSFDLWLDDVMVLAGRRIVTGCDLVGAFAFGIGKIVAAGWETANAEPNRANLPSGAVRLFQIGDA